jgi:hypothetical protein
MRTIIAAFALLLAASPAAIAEPIIVSSRVWMVPVFGAQAGWVTIPITPLVWVNRKPPGAVVITRTASRSETLAICPLTSGYGCTTRTAAGCEIFIPRDEVLAEIGYPYAMVLEHELAHCAGWGPNHEGMTWARVPRWTGGIVYRQHATISWPVGLNP